MSFLSMLTIITIITKLLITITGVVCIEPQKCSRRTFGFHHPNYLQQRRADLTCQSSVTGIKTMNSIPAVVNANNVKLLNQNEAIQVDLDLFNEYKFSVDQLMELAGLSVATAIAQVYDSKKRSGKVLVVTGPGNNGGDGLVVARHLKLFGFEDVTILNARKPTKDLYINLLHQAEQNDVEISYDPERFRNDTASIIVDALFGFSFKPPVRPDFQPFLDVIVSATSKSIPVVAVDIPSGWDVENGPPKDESTFYMPEMLVSLTAPKACASHFLGLYHFIGGRFVPKKLADKYSLNLPAYPGTDCIVRIK